jgi:hypothetical protein
MPWHGTSGASPSFGWSPVGIGGKYAAVNSAIDELIPAKYRKLG